jgi:hypothetical protein
MFIVKDILKVIGGILILGMLFSACSSLADNSTTPNDWDADGDSFDSGDMDAYFEYKSNQE